MLTFALLILLLVTVAMTITTESWHRGIVALACHYVICFALASATAPNAILAGYLISGGLTCAILFVTMRHVARFAQNRRISAGDDARPASSERHYRIAATILAAAVTYSLAESYPLPDTSISLSFAIYWLAAAGLFSLCTAARGWPMGVGVVLLTSSSQLLLSTTGLGTVPILFLSGTTVNILVALGITYLLNGENPDRTLE